MHLPQRLSSRAAFVALTLAASLSAAHADTLNADGQWVDFTVSRLMSGDLGWSNFDGQALSFDFTVAEGFVATLSVVDAGWSGDRFTVTNSGQEIGTTSVAVLGNQGTPAIVDFDEAFADSNFSRGVYSLNAGQHSISGFLSTSFLSPDEGTIGAVRLQVSAVPEPASVATLLAGLSLLTVMLRRKNGKDGK
ncbi:PEP-CTERM sorting domain-containing protein [Paucibacter sp. Y2R2-4]|uniref:PEP-CTERM sorting domain-containing protein n=1 Tax=Paucibacter sp. Y2R2-4 TaxID=2893553 RepID=UPI0021E421B1|nr:PEP-CTERM sorting domain-containing protein [Paucibacter sp. Y2R2-4]MCV2349382.1 PEP-CTERM sorting domain-containing protein [Paucibacter sp. Y2R2-4]